METCFKPEGEPTKLWMEQAAQRGCAGSVLGAAFSRLNCRKPRAGPALGRGGQTRDLLRDPVILSTHFLTSSPHPATCVNYFTESLKKKKKKKRKILAQRATCKFIRQLHEVIMLEGILLSFVLEKNCQLK